MAQELVIISLNIFIVKLVPFSLDVVLGKSSTTWMNTGLILKSCHFFLFYFFNRVPTPVAVVISAAVFALAHLTPGEFPQLFVLGKQV